MDNMKLNAGPAETVRVLAHSGRWHFLKFARSPFTCGTGIAKKLYVTAQRESGDLPARPRSICPGPQAWTKAHRKHVGSDPAPATCNVMTEFMNGHYDRQGQHKKNDHPKHIAELRRQRNNVQFPSPLLLAVRIFMVMASIFYTYWQISMRMAITFSARLENRKRRQSKCRLYAGNSATGAG